jgi:hypothetical protein
MARLIRRRLARLERLALEAEYVRHALDLAREQRRNLSEVLVMAREDAAWWRWEHARHPPLVRPDGRIDFEPCIRRWAVWTGLDPDVAVRELRARVEGRRADESVTEPATEPFPSTDQGERGGYPCPLCAERGETTMIPTGWQHCGCLGRILAERAGDDRQARLRENGTCG